MIKVGIVGFGTIGRRVADAINLQPDMKVVGVVKNSPDYGLRIAREKGYRVFSTDGKFESEGTIENLIDESEIIIDTAPGKIGALNKEKFYVPRKIPAIYQGGEKASIGQSFSTLANYNDAKGKSHVRVVSCNTTGLARLLSTINPVYPIREVKVALIRRAADPKEYKKGPIDAIIPDPVGISHHAPDLQTVMSVDIITTAYKVPTTIMHMHDIEVIGKNRFDEGQIYELLKSEPRIALFDPEKGFKSTAQIMDYAREFRPRGDLYENAIFSGFTVNENRLYISQAIHQESIVVPENIDAIRAMMNIELEESIEKTNKSLELGKLQP